MPSTRPRIAFAKSNICNACNYKNKIKKINYQNRDRELKKILRDNKSKKSKYDCIVPWSGGKDSSYVAYQLKFKYGANPLLVTFSPLIPSKVGEHNRNELINLHSKATSIVLFKRVLLPKIERFFSLIDLLPPLAGIRAIIFLLFN